MAVPKAIEKGKLDHHVLCLTTWSTGTCHDLAVTQWKETAYSRKETFQLACEERALRMWKCLAIN